MAKEASSGTALRQRCLRPLGQTSEQEKRAGVGTLKKRETTRAHGHCSIRSGTQFNNGKRYLAALCTKCTPDLSRMVPDLFPFGRQG